MRRAHGLRLRVFRLCLQPGMAAQVIRAVRATPVTREEGETAVMAASAASEAVAVALGPVAVAPETQGQRVMWAQVLPLYRKHSPEEMGGMEEPGGPGVQPETLETAAGQQ